MIAAITGSPGAGSFPGAAVAGGRALDAELARSEVKLSDWVHCVSASTPHGKAKIAEISAKVSDIKSKMKAAEQSNPAAPQQTQAGAGPLGHVLNVFA